MKDILGSKNVECVECREGWDIEKNRGTKKKGA